MRREATPWAMFVLPVMIIAFVGWCVVCVGSDEWTEVD